MPIGNFLQGLLGGLATGMVEGSIRQKNEEFLQERQRMATAAELLKSGNYEAFALIDPKLHKAMGLEGDSLQAIQALAGMQRQTRQRQQQKEEVQLGEAQIKQRLANIELTDKEQELSVPREERPEVKLKTTQAKTAEFNLKQAEAEEKRINALPPDKQLIARYPNIANYDLQVQRFEAEKAARSQEHQDRVNDLQARIGEINARLAETKRANQAAESEHTLTREERTRAAKATEQIERDRTQAQKELKEEMEKGRRLTIATTEYEKAIIARDKVRSTAPIESKIGKNSHPVFTSESDAKEFVTRMNRAEERVSRADQQKAKLEGREPDEPFVWKYHSDPTGFLGLGSGRHIAFAEQGGSSTAAPEGAPASDALRDKLNRLNPQGASQPQPSVTETTTDNPIRTYTPESGPSRGAPVEGKLRRKVTYPESTQEGPSPSRPVKAKITFTDTVDESNDPNTPKYIAEFKKNAPKEYRYNASAIARYVELRRTSTGLKAAKPDEILDYVINELEFTNAGNK